ncbi:MAG: P27 family phage terminase small subunit [Pseudomonadota bacterium]
MSQNRPVENDIALELMPGAEGEGGENVLPPAPTWLSKRGGLIYGALTRIFEERGLATRDDGFMLGILASRIEEIETATAVIEAEGTTYETRGFDGAVIRRPRPEVAQRNDALRHAQSLLSEFGMSPSARSRMQGLAMLNMSPVATETDEKNADEA